MMLTDWLSAAAICVGVAIVAYQFGKQKGIAMERSRRENQQGAGQGPAPLQ